VVDVLDNITNSTESRASLKRNNSSITRKNADVGSSKYKFYKLIALSSSNN
jgi:hypothetical protein